MNEYDIVIIGGGIVGISTAWQLKRKYGDAKILLIEKENAIAQHQTQHNSGVIHAGVYYKPDSLKSDFCKRGSSLTIDFCDEYNLPYERCGKMLVATNQMESDRMKELEINCEKNGIATQRLSKQELTVQEPSITGSGALFVPATGITDYQKISKQMADLFERLGGELILGKEIKALSEKNQKVTIHLEKRKVTGSFLLACAGLQADRVAKMIGIKTDFKIIPFRGEYYRLSAEHNKIVNHLIYPIPDPELPFLGVHLTKMIDGTVTVGPNAVLGYKREGYGRINFSLKDVSDMFIFPGFWRVVKSNFKSGIAETIDSWYKPGYLKRVQKYCPKIQLSDLTSYPAGIRAQAVMDDGSLVHDFLFHETERSLHVCNAPSPAATSAMPIGEYICTAIEKKFSL